jgi:AcrR family transcriptional regulator
MPTGVAMRDAREQLFDAAERVLLRDGPNALTSRAVTTEAGCAKGVLHRHFADIDTFLTELVLDRVTRIGDNAGTLRAAGTGTVAANLADALRTLFGPVTMAILGLVTSHDDVRARLRDLGPTGGVPVLAEAAAMIASYLTDERDLGRIAADADVDTLALTLVGATHLRYAGQETCPVDAGDVDRIVATVMADVLQRRLL